MSSQPTHSVLQKLKLAVKSDKISAETRETGSRILRRLDAPVRVLILGAVGSGKSQLLNFLVGQEIVPPNATWPRLEVRWGSKTKAWVARAGGEPELFSRGGHQKIGGTDITLIQIETPASFLEDICLSEGVALQPKSPDTIDWVAERADIVLWCGQDLSKQDRALWTKAPDSLKDHSFFVLTKADLLSDNDILADRIEQLQDIVAEEFHSLLPLATLQAILVANSAAALDKKLLRASGGEALMAAILHQAATGRQSDIDNARLYLRRHGLDAEICDPAKSDPAKTDTPHNEQAATACAYLEQRAQTLGRFDADKICEILEFCVETANCLVELLLDDLSDDAAFAAIQDETMQIADILLLMQLENGAGSAADAVTVLLQLRRDMQVAIAA